MSLGDSLKNRSTVDIVVILMTLMVGMVLFLATLGVITLKLLNPNADLRGAEGAVGSILTTVVGALVGLIGGRASEKVIAPNGAK